MRELESSNNTNKDSAFKGIFSEIEGYGLQDEMFERRGAFYRLTVQPSISTCTDKTLYRTIKGACPNYY